MKKKVIILLILLFLLINSISYGINPTTSAESAILMDFKSGRILYSFNQYKKLPMASTTKIMTALVAIENGNMNDIVKIKKECVGIEGSSIYLYEGEEISLKDLLYGLMLRSGNDAALAIATYIGGDVDNFIEMMNRKAKEIGALNTKFENPHGLESENHYTTAYDLALITREALKYEEFREIVSSKKWVADRDKNNYFYNKNKTLWQYENGDGVKIGYTKRAGRCLVSSASRNSMQLIAVVLNDRDWFSDCYKLFDYGFENYFPWIVYDKGQFVKNVKIIGGNKDYIPVVTDEYCILPLKKEEKDKVNVYIDLPKELLAPVKAHEDIGKITVYLNGKIVFTSRLVSKAEAKKIKFLSKIKKSLWN